MMKNYVAQEDVMGCGVACVANRLGISYPQALQLFDRPGDAKTIGYKCKYIVEALRRGGVEARLHHIKPPVRHAIISGSHPDIRGVIVLLVRSELYPYQHYLLKMPEGWIDPWINMHDDPDIRQARVGVRHVLPGEPYYAIY